MVYDIAIPPHARRFCRIEHPEIQLNSTNSHLATVAFPVLSGALNAAAIIGSLPLEPHAWQVAKSHTVNPNIAQVARTIAMSNHNSHMIYRMPAVPTLNEPSTGIFKGCPFPIARNFEARWGVVADDGVARRGYNFREGSHVLTPFETLAQCLSHLGP